MKNLDSLRTDYVKGEMNMSDLSDSPIEQLTSWLNDAVNAKILDPNAFCLSTVNSEGYPKGRIILAKGIEEEGLVFYTNKQSSKSEELRANAKAGITFFWPELERQVCIFGTVTPISDEENDAYFSSRPRDSQLGAWVSDQSEPMKSRKVLELALETVRARFADVEKIDRPPHWGGYLVTFVKAEFWQGRASRLHDRILYTKDEGGEWKKKLIQP